MCGFVMTNKWHGEYFWFSVFIVRVTMVCVLKKGYELLLVFGDFCVAAAKASHLN